MTKVNLKKTVANFFGALGYLSCSLQWLWAVLLYASLIKMLALFFTPVADNSIVAPVSAPTSSNPNIFLIIFSAIVVITMILLTIYIFIKIPMTIIKSSKKVVHEAADNVAPILLKVQHKKDTKKNKIKLAPLLVVFLKVILITTPIVLSFMSQFIQEQTIEFYVAMYASIWLAGFSFAFFIFQYSIGGLFSIKRQDLW